MNCFSLNTLPQAAGGVIAKAAGWTPLGETVMLHVDHSSDPYLAGRRITGVVRAWGMGGWEAPLLVELSRNIYRIVHLRQDYDSRLVVLVPAVRGHGYLRLLVTWSAVRIVAATSFRDDSYERTIGTGRVALAKASDESDP